MLDTKRTWSEWIGDPSVFSLERRIFHSISIGLVLLLCFYVPYNLYAGLYIASLSALIIGFFFFFQYYSSRYRNKPHNSFLFGLMGLIIFSVNYFTNSGIHGSTDLIWPVYLLLVLAISPYNQHLFWLLVYLLCFLVLHIVEYEYPSLIKYPFDIGKGQFIDRITAFPIPVIAVYIITKYIRRSYDKERKAAEEKTIAVQTLMSIISHDLRTPLTNVQGYLELLQDHQLNSPERAELEEALRKSTNNTMSMLSNLLHWSKSQIDGPRVWLQKINLLDTLRQTLDMEQMQGLNKGITLNHDISPNLIVVADVDMLQLVVRNLISNAIKFTPHGGQIDVGAQSGPNGCTICIRDNGVGISKDLQSKIFSIKPDPQPGTDNERGVGLGLVLCKEFVERQRGKIGFNSEPGQGTTFYISLPVG